MLSEDKTPKQTLVAEGTELKGSLSSTWAVVVNGKVDGRIDAPEITVARAGAVLGAVKTKKLRSHGTLSGTVDAGDVFLSGAVLSNTVIRATTLEIKVGSSNSGQLEVIFGESGIGLNDSATDAGASSASSSSEPAPSTADVDEARAPATDGW